jgi:type I restriction enzyme M protein
MHPFTEYKEKFDKEFGHKDSLDCFLPVNETSNAKSKIKGASGKPNEEYYKWQFLYALVYSGMYAKDYIGTEVYFPKGNKSLFGTPLGSNERRQISSSGSG